MWKQIQAFAMAGAILAMACSVAGAAEVPQKLDRSGLPKGSYSGSCTCQLSGGVTLMCFCSNVQAKMFETMLDVRSCVAPKDIKNCDGRLTCTASAATACPAH